MKKAMLSLAAVFLTLSITACQKTYETPEALVERARAGFSDRETEIKYAGRCDRDTFALLWFVSGGNAQEHQYIPLECTVRDGGLEFERSFRAMERGVDIAVLQWRDGYSFLINNESCQVLKITDDLGTHEFAVDEYPYIWYNETLPSEYVFLDENGNELQSF
ncbi:MAG: hypothetical protein HDR72_01330 [Ruminococcaceae bacterium]|nr:hypothetical protein [Oscillospiraceae bacterium]